MQAKRWKLTMLNGQVVVESVNISENAVGTVTLTRNGVERIAGFELD